MKVKTVVVSRYPVFKAGLKRVLGPGFCITSFFDNIANLLTSNIDADLIVLDDKASKDLALLKKRPNFAILKFSLEENAGFLYVDTKTMPRAALQKAVCILAESLTSKDPNQSD